MTTAPTTLEKPAPAPHVPADATLGANLAAGLARLRDRRGLTYADLAGISGVPAATIHRIVSGGPTCNPGVFAVYRLAVALGTTVEGLVTGREI